MDDNKSAAAGNSYYRPETRIYEDVMDEFEKKYRDNLPEPRECEEIILSELKTEIQMENAIQFTGQKGGFKVPQKLPPLCVARLVSMTGRVAYIRMHDKSQRLAIYYNEGEYKGLWKIDMDETSDEHRELTKLIYSFNPLLSPTDYKDIEKRIFAVAPVREESRSTRYIPVKNGVYDIVDKELIDWDNVPEDFTFTHKINHNYVKNAPKVYLKDNSDGYTFEVDSWLLEVLDTPEKVENMYEVFADVVMPYNFQSRRAVFFIDGIGNGCNGKGSVCELITQLAGGEKSDNVTAISLEQWGKDFLLTSLPFATVSISHEQVEGMYFDKVDALKAAITADPVLINVKHKSAFTYKPYIVVVFCTNSWPKVKDDTGAWQRRLLIIQFLHDYRGTKEKPYIKQRYLKDERVLEYVLSKVLEQYSDRTEFTLFPYLEENLKEYKDKTRPVDMFMKEYAARFKWKFVPFTFLYDAFTRWYESTYNKTCGIGSPTFINDIAVWCLESDPKKQFKPTVNEKGTVQRVCCKKEYRDSFENDEEPIIYQLNLDKEFPNRYELKNRTKGYLKTIPQNVSGLLRIKEVNPDEDVIEDFN